MAQTTTDKTASPPQPTRPITLDEYLELIDEEAYEVIDGEPVAMSPQHLQSSVIGRVLFLSLHEHVHPRKLGYVTMETVFALEVDQPSNWLRGSLVPDIAFVGSERLQQHKQQNPKEKGAFRVAPDLVIEVISPTDRFISVMRKVKRYLSYGVRLVIVVDPVNRVVHLFTPEKPGGVVLGENETLTGAPVLPEWSISIKELLEAEPGV